MSTFTNPSQIHQWHVGQSCGADLYLTGGEEGLQLPPTWQGWVPLRSGPGALVPEVGRRICTRLRHPEAPGANCCCLPSLFVPGHRGCALGVPQLFVSCPISQFCWEMRIFTHCLLSRTAKQDFSFMGDQWEICRQQRKGSLAEHQELQQCRGPKVLAVPGGWKCCFPNPGIPLECYDPEVLEPALSPRFSKYSQINRSNISLILLSLSEAKSLQQIVSLWSSIQELSLCAGLILWETRKYHQICSRGGWYHWTTHPFKMR